MIRSKNSYTGKKIRITNILIKGEIYENLLPNTMHKIIKPPGITKNSEKGVWVMGNGYPAYIMQNEFNYIKYTRTK
jgi:hypothetical protein